MLDTPILSTLKIHGSFILKFLDNVFQRNLEYPLYSQQDPTEF